jgi:hypothetical protein
MTDTTHVGFSDHTATPTDAPSSATAEAAPASAPLDYTFVRMPDGTVQAVLTSAIVDATHGDGLVATAVSDAPKPSTAPKPEAQFYVWLANGEVVRVKESDLPMVGGTNAVFGHWQVGNKVYLVIGVYPVEDIITEGK